MFGNQLSPLAGPRIAVDVGFGRIGMDGLGSIAPRGVGRLSIMGAGLTALAMDGSGIRA